MMVSFLLSSIAAVWQALGLLFLFILFVEFGIDPLRRLMRRLRRPKPSDLSVDAPAAADASSGYHDDIVRQGLDWAAYVHWRQRPYRGRYTTIDARGLRATVGEGKDGANVVRIFCFGGSTLFCLGARDAGTIPSALQSLLGEAGLQVSVTNQAQLAYNSSQDFLTLQALLKCGDVPDVAVFYNGFNDMFAAEWRGSADTIRGEEGRRAEFKLLSADRRSDLFWAALASLLPRSFRRIREWRGLEWSKPLADTVHRPLAEAVISRLARDVVSVYAANVRMARALAREYGFQAVFVWEPSLATKKVVSEHERQAESDRVIDIAVRRKFFSAVISEYHRHPALAGAPDVVDLSALFDDRDDLIYIDFAHLTEAANAAVAEAMLPAVTAAVTSAQRR